MSSTTVFIKVETFLFKPNPASFSSRFMLTKNISIWKTTKNLRSIKKLSKLIIRIPSKIAKEKYSRDVGRGYKICMEELRVRNWYECKI